MKKVFFVCALLCTSLLSAAGIYLVNDSPFQLRVVIRGNTGMALGEVTLLPQQSKQWAGAWWQSGYQGKQSQVEWYNSSQTPYTIVWFCPQGNKYGANYDVPPGATVNARSSDGPRSCRPPVPKHPSGDETTELDEFPPARLPPDAGPPGGSQNFGPP